MSFQERSRSNYSTEKKKNNFEQADIHLCFTNLHFNRLSKKIGDEHTKIVDSVSDYSFQFENSMVLQELFLKSLIVFCI